MPALLGRVVGRQVPIGRLLGWQLYCHPWGDSTTIAPTKALLGRSLSAAISGCFMLWLGLLSVVQVAFLPGYLVLCALRLAVRPAQTLVLSFALSLVLNHFLVLALVLLGCYRAGVMYAIFALEAAAFCLDRPKMAAVDGGRRAGAAEGDSPIFVDTKIGTVPENRGGTSPAQALIAGAAVLVDDRLRRARASSRRRHLSENGTPWCRGTAGRWIGPPMACRTQRPSIRNCSPATCRSRMSSSRTTRSGSSPRG